MSIKQENKRITITIDPETEDLLEWLKIASNEKQVSKIICRCIKYVVKKWNEKQ